MNDILVDDNGNIVGFGESTEQNLTHLLKAEKGEVRSFPLMGVGLRGWLNDDRNGDMTTAMRRQLSKDGAKVSALRYNKDGGLEIDANY